MSITDHLRQLTILHHAFDIQILDTDHIVVFDDLCTELLLKVDTAVSDLLIDLCDLCLQFPRYLYPVALLIPSSSHETPFLICSIISGVICFDRSSV